MNLSAGGYPGRSAVCLRARNPKTEKEKRKLTKGPDLLGLRGDRVKLSVREKLEKGVKDNVDLRFLHRKWQRDGTLEERNWIPRPLAPDPNTPTKRSMFNSFISAPLKL